MIFLTKDGLEDNKSFKEIIKKEEQMIVMMIESQNIKSNILSDSMQRFADYADTDLEKVDDKMDSIIFFLNNFKNTLALSKTNIYLLNNVLDSIKKIEEIFTKDDEKKTEKIEEYNNNFIETNEIVLANTIQIEQTLKYILSFSEFAFDSKNKLNKLITDIGNKTLDIEWSMNNQKRNCKQLNSIPIDECLIEEIDLKEHPENTLIVSEKEDVVILPFTIDELNKIYVGNKGKYEDFNEIIDNKYTVPLSRFRNTAIARFREAFMLMRRKEKETLKKSFELGMELFFNYNLHPAIITACKSIDQLDIYLDYLDANETERFDCFKIIFDIAPVEVKSSKFNVLISKIKKMVEKDAKVKEKFEETLENNSEINSDIEKIITSIEKEEPINEINEINQEEKFTEVENIENIESTEIVLEGKSELEENEVAEILGINENKIEEKFETTENNLVENVQIEESNLPDKLVAVEGNETKEISEIIVNKVNEIENNEKEKTVTEQESEVPKSSRRKTTSKKTPNKEGDTQKSSTKENDKTENENRSEETEKKAKNSSAKGNDKTENENKSEETEKKSKKSSTKKNDKTKNEDKSKETNKSASKRNSIKTTKKKI
ncbi:MAG: hypothetical protein IKL55_00635 [Clostridia bacterium]|nr:hypothetical protein [Clostridia bacterium]